ncbi:MAG TPA: hypothetical protein PKH09_04335 [Parvularculaceae bacterium]|nr:hypothetical protein [Parvularculaceae bacterium]
MNKTLKKEQVELLRFEKQLLALGSGLVALSAGAGAGAANVVGDFANEHVAEMQAAYLKLVETVQAAHDAVEASAVSAGVDLLQARGQPKASVLETALSLFGMR